MRIAYILVLVVLVTSYSGNLAYILVLVTSYILVVSKSLLSDWMQGEKENDPKV